MFDQVTNTLFVSCDDFYEYACGKFLNVSYTENILLVNKNHMNLFNRPQQFLMIKHELVHLQLPNYAWNGS